MSELLHNVWFWVAVVLLAFEAVHFALHFGAGAGLIVAIVKALKVSVHKWESKLAQFVTGELGLPGWTVEWLVDLSAGGKVEAAGAFDNMVRRALTVDGQAEIDKGFLAKARSNPTRWARFKTIINDVDQGIDPTADIKTALNADFENAPTLKGQVSGDLSDTLGAVGAFFRDIGTHTQTMGNAFTTAIKDAGGTMVNAGTDAAQVGGNLVSGTNGADPTQSSGAPAPAAAAAPGPTAPAGHAVLVLPPGTPAINVPAIPATPPAA